MLDNPIALLGLWLVGAVLLGVGIGFVISDMSDDDDEIEPMSDWEEIDR
jgi:hypothetical protein